LHFYRGDKIGLPNSVYRAIKLVLPNQVYRSDKIGSAKIKFFIVAIKFGLPGSFFIVAIKNQFQHIKFYRHDKN